MAVLGLMHVALEVADLQPGIKFYTDAGLSARVEGDRAYLRCDGQDRDSILLIGGAPKKRLHHLALRFDATWLDEVRRKVPELGGLLIEPPAGFEGPDLWLRDPNGMVVRLVDAPAEQPLAEAPSFEINGPGRLVRKRRSAILPQRAYAPAKPLRLGHALFFSPDVPVSIRFYTEALGMGLADHSGDIIAFLCCRKDSDHHVVAFAKSPGVGFHHASFQVSDPDEVGRGGRALIAATGKGDWGFGRHTIGSNFFHYIQDPWGSWFEYYSDMDHIDDYALWSPTNYAPEDSLASWGPSPPGDFVHNYEIEPQPA